MAAKFLEVLVVVACSWLAPEVKGQPPGDDLTLIVDIEEESPSQSFVVNIGEGTDLDNLFNSSHQDQLEFGIIPQPDGLDSYFHMDPESGILRTAARIDRELLCPEQADCILTMGISVKDVADMFEIIPIQINILDINDNPPEFIPAMFRLTFSENDGIGSKRDLPVAMDTDSPNFGIQSYRLITSYPEFTLETFPNPVTGYLDVRLVLSDQLDREWKESYEMTVEAVDGGDQTGQLRVEVTVRDENDHSPQFQNSSVSITVPEDHPVDQPLYQMRAVDDDTGDNARVTYSYSPRTANLYAAFFYLNSTSGQVSLLVPLDYEMRKIFHLEIMASDYGPSPRSTQAMLMIHVLDVNDNSPVVTLSSQSGGADIPQIQENLPPGKFVSHVFVFDADDGQNAQVSCDLNEPGFELELIRKDQYKIVTTAVLDREVTPEHVLHLVCQDQGVPSLTTYTPIQVTILDENDNPPVFERTSYVATVPENNARHASLFRVTATDQDAADNARLSFSIVDDQHSVLNYIYITPDGTIHASGVFDYEDTKELVFSVHATDHGTPVQEATVTATLKILDVNDEAPHFLRTDYTFQVEENQDPHSFLGEVTAQDLDTPPFNIFEYSIASTQPGIAQPPTFAINPASGEIMTLRPLDREEQEVYHMTVVATDLDNPRLQGSASVTIQVEDKNDNSPEIFFPPQNNSFRVSNRVPEGYNITGVFALDEDAGKNAKLSYQIVSGNEDRVFKIDSESGILSTNSKLQHFEYEQFNIGILVSDKGTPSQLGTITLVITVDDTIPYSQGFAPNSGIVRGQNLTIIIAVAAASGFVIIVLVIAILVLKTRGVQQGCLCQGGLQRCRKVLKSTSPSPASPWHTVTSSPVIQVEATLPVPHGSYPGRDDTCMQVTASTPAYAEQKNLAHSFQYPKVKLDHISNSLTASPSNHPSSLLIHMFYNDHIGSILGWNISSQM